MTIIQYRLNISMTDKELFEKTEKTFNLKKENVLIENIFDKGNFKKVLNEIRTSADPAAASGGGLLGQIGSAVKYLSPTQARIRKAEARKAEIEAQMAQQRLMKGQSTNDTQTKPKEGTQERDKYDNDGRYRRVWNAYAKGEEKDLSKADIEYYETVNASIDKATLDTAAQTAAIDAAKKEKKKLRQKEVAEFENSILSNAPKTAKELINKGQFGFYINFMFGDKVNPVDLKKTALTIGNLIQFDYNELQGIRRLISSNPKITSGARESFLSDLPTQVTKKSVATDKPKKPSAEQIINKKILKSAKNNNRSKAEQIKFQNEKAKEEFNIGDSVKSTLRNTGKGDILFDVVGFDTKTGTVVVKTVGKTPRTLKKLPGEIEPFTMKLKPEDKDEMKDTIKKAMGESFEQIVKRYR